MKNKIAVFIGTRPEAIKMAPVIHALNKSKKLEPVVISTGQHLEMLNQVIKLFDLPVHHELNVMTQNQSLASLSARLIERIDLLLEDISPDFALLQGDTTTVLTGALSCFYRKVPIGHVEAGLRTGDIYSPFPEEANRKLVSPLASLHFAPTIKSKNNLLDEGIPCDKIFVTGNTVIDALKLEIAEQMKPNVRKEVHLLIAELLSTGWEEKDIVLITGHRRENFGSGFKKICDAIKQLSILHPETLFVYPVHLNPKVSDIVNQMLSGLSNVILIPPQSYRPFVALMNVSKLILTDSGGVQEEAPSLGKPVLVMRDTTERPEGVESDTVKLVGSDVQSIVKGVNNLLLNPVYYKQMSEAKNPYGEGDAANKIILALENFIFANTV